MAVLIANVAKANQRLEDLSAAVETEQESVNKALVDVEDAREQRRGGRTRTRGQPAGGQGCERGHRRGAAPVQHLRGGHLYERSVGQLPDRAQPGGHHRRGDAPPRLWPPAPQTVHGKAAAGAHRAGEQGVGARGWPSRRPTGPPPTPRPARTRRRRRSTTPNASSTNNARKSIALPPSANRPRPSSRRPKLGRVDRAPAGQGAPPSGGMWDPGHRPGPAAARWDGWDPTLPQVPSANIPGDPIAVINQVLGYSATSAQVTASMGKQLPAAAGHPQARRHRHHQRPGGCYPGPDSAGLRAAGLRVRDPPRHVADRGALFLGWRQCGGPE